MQVDILHPATFAGRQHAQSELVLQSSALKAPPASVPTQVDMSSLEEVSVGLRSCDINARLNKTLYCLCQLHNISKIASNACEACRRHKAFSFVVSSDNLSHKIVPS